MRAEPAGPGEVSDSPARRPHLPPIARISAAVAAAARARCAYVERFTAEATVVEVLGGSGEGTPPPGLHPARSGEPAADTLVLPLVVDREVRGAIVALGAAPEHLRDPTLRPMLVPLCWAGALAITEHGLREELKDATSDADERHFRLVSGTAHHLRDLLGVSSAYLQLLENETSLTETQLEYLRASRRNMELAVRLMAELLDLGRVETGRMALEWAPIDVRAVTRGMLRDYERAGLTLGIRIQVRLDDPLPLISSDLDMLNRVLDTLFSNAFRYSPQGGEVVIGASVRTGRRAGDPSKWICVTVADQGPGVRQHDEVFEEIKRVEASTSPGLRLAISRRLARLLGGDLTLEPDAGSGSTFTLWLPVRAPASRMQEQRPQRARPGGRDPALA